MGRGPYWPETRTPKLIAPTLDATSGRSYSQSSQTPGALGGRRAKEVWFKEGTLPSMEPPGINVGQIIKIAGSAWRLIDVTARLRVAIASYAEIRINIWITLPGESEYTLFYPHTLPYSNLLRILGSTKEAIKGTMRSDKSNVLPIGTLVRMGYNSSFSGASARDLTVELHYRTRAVSQ